MVKFWCNDSNAVLVFLTKPPATKVFSSRWTVLALKLGRFLAISLIDDQTPVVRELRTVAWRSVLDAEIFLFFWLNFSSFLPARGVPNDGVAPDLGPTRVSRSALSLLIKSTSLKYSSRRIDKFIGEEWRS